MRGGGGGNVHVFNFMFCIVNIRFKKSNFQGMGTGMYKLILACTTNRSYLWHPLTVCNACIIKCGGMVGFLVNLYALYLMQHMHT